MSKEKLSVILYVPNIIDYLRLALLIYGWIYIDVPSIFLICYIIQVILDFFDGYFAKLLNQISSYGAWLDVVLDNLGRGLLWTYLYRAGFLLSCIEWIAFSCTQRYGANWKQFFNESPLIVRSVFKNNFKTFTGITAITAGLQGLPIWLYIMKHYLLSFNLVFTYVSYTLLAYCLAGRLICLYVEIWVIYKNLEQMIITDCKLN